MLVAGGSGLIGTELIAQLTAAGHTVQRLVRRPPRTGDEFSWAPDAKILDFRLLESVDAVVNLSGASLNRIPWTARYREQILRSRVKATEALVEAMAMSSSPPPDLPLRLGRRLLRRPARRDPDGGVAARHRVPRRRRRRVGGRSPADAVAHPHRRCSAPASCSRTDGVRCSR